MPTSEVAAAAAAPAGFEATGKTVSRGNTIDEFPVTVLGVLKDGVGVGHDMIIVNVHDYSAMDDPPHPAEGIWAGMSGSPVYAADGRLIGAVAFGLALGPSTIGGVTPAADMLNVLNALPAAVAPRSVRATRALQTKMLATGAVTAKQAASRFEPLRIPLAVTGLNSSRLQTFADRLPGSERFIPFHAGGASLAAGPGDPSLVTDGSNFAAALSYGDVSIAGVGTTTAVCGDHVVAFGHPMNFDGPTALSAHNADAIVIQNDPTLNPFKLANIGGFVGTLDQDRLSGVRTLLGAPPPPVVVTSRVNSDGGPDDLGETDVNRTIDTPDIAAGHLVSNIDSVIDRIGAGTNAVGWTVTGIAGGEQFSLTRNNKFADSFDISFASADELFSDLLAVVDNPFTDVKLTGVTMNAAVKSPFREYRITGLQQFKGGRWVTVGDSDTVELTPGSTLRMRVLLANFRNVAPVAPVELRFPVPADATGDGSLDIMGGSDNGDGGGEFSTADDSSEPASFKDLLAALRDAPRNDELTGTLSLFGGGGPELLDASSSSSPAPASVTKRLAEVVTGALSVSVAVAGSGEPPHPSEPPTVALGGKSTLKLRTALRKGLRITVTSSAPGRLVARAFVDKKTARRLKIKKNATGPVVVASVTKIIGDGRSHVALKFTRKAKKRLVHAKRVKLTLRATVTDVDGNRGADREKLVLKRRLR